MAKIIYPNEALPHLANRILADGIMVHLYVNEVTGGKAAVLTDFEEPVEDGDGYMPLEFTEWVLQTVVFNHGVNGANIAEFDNESGDDYTIVGYFVTNLAGDKLLWFSEFDEPLEWNGVDGHISFQPTYVDFSRYPEG